MRTITISTTLVVMTLALSLAAWGADRQVGTWILNVAKSKYNPGPAPKSGTLKIEAQENGLKFTIDGIDAEDKPIHFEFAPKYDGKDYPATGLPTADTIALKRVDANTIEAVAKKAGKVVTTTRSTVSKDGKTRTTTQTGKNAMGLDLNNTMVYEKQ
ncbi:MAG: hypothetical protein DMG06_21630 [Acidobacteria bacterium]|nr:MAG: hypothetical protein DMG06_21630 [Acidobacteriota bacterium]